MEPNTLAPAIVFLAGVVSFLSPCVLPLVPAYLAFFGGVSVDVQGGQPAKPRNLLLPTLAFVAGFTVVFVALGLGLTALGTFLIANQSLLTRIAGGLIIIMGLAFLGVIPLPWLYREKRVEVSPSKTVPGSFVMGLAFAFGWTPCIGPILGAVLALAATEQVPGRGAFLLFVYSIGLGVPFVATALGASRMLGAMRWLRKHQGRITQVGGAFLIVVGLLFVFDKMFLISSWIQRGMDAVGLDFLSNTL